MPIFPLPQFEADLALDRTEREAYERLNTPKTVVVRFGVMKMVGEFPFNLNVKPGCGTKMVARTHRGTELAEMLTSTCPNAGCSKSVTRKEMLEYIENSGGKDYPYFNDGSILRIATTDDLNEQRRIDGLRPAMKRFAQQAADAMGVPMKVVDAEPILGGERLTFYFTADDRVDFRDLVQELSREYPARIELRQVGARDEARLIADYEKCGQHCCCKQFLKVLKPISMKSAKIQKATLDPLKISGRCGRLMCCLRYEDETYDALRKRLPRMKSRVNTPEGPGTVMDAQILTQLVLVELDADGKRVAVPVENLGTDAPPPPMPRPMGPGPSGPAGGPGAGGPRGGRPAPGASGGGGASAPRRPSPEKPPAGAMEDHDDDGVDEAPSEDPLRGLSAEDVQRRLGGAPGTGAEQAGAPSPRQESFRERDGDRGRERRPDSERPRRVDGDAQRPPRPEGQPRRDQRPPQQDRRGAPGGEGRGPGDRASRESREPREPRPPQQHQRREPRPAAEGAPNAERPAQEGPPDDASREPGQSPTPGGGKRRRRRRRGGRSGGGGGGGGGPPQGGPSNEPGA
ncbi:MAG: regulatory iron-sulfur-containing complex subunit RicT [Phycisphaerales bacterium]